MEALASICWTFAHLDAWEFVITIYFERTEILVLYDFPQIGKEPGLEVTPLQFHFPYTSHSWIGRNIFISFECFVFFLSRSLESSYLILYILALTYGRWFGQNSQPVKIFTSCIISGQPSSLCCKLFVTKPTNYLRASYKFLSITWNSYGIWRASATFGRSMTLFQITLLFYFALDLLGDWNVDLQSALGYIKICLKV